MSATVATPVCANPACRVAETGKCVEGLELSSCSHYGRAPTKDEQAGVPKPDGIPLGSGDRLEVKSAPEVLRGRETRVVAVLGGREAGKTSLIAGLFGLFLDGSVGGYSFAGSRTLPAFEIACHDARAVSARQAPHFERTPRGPAGLYQVTLSQSAGGGDLVDLLIADRAGEEYLEVTDDIGAANELPELTRADVITLLVDGRRLLDVGERHNLQGDLSLMLQALHDGDTLTGRQRLAIALTKHDRFDGSPEEARAERDFAAFVSRTRAQFGQSFSTVEAFRLAAAPDSAAVRRGTGLQDLLKFWMRRATPRSLEMVPSARPTRAFGRLPPPAR